MKLFFGILCGVILVAAVLFILFVILVKPAKHRVGVEKYTRVHYAHRGLHDETHAENSLSAFRRAVECGYGIELDVRLAKDGRLVVFHDPTLERVTGIAGKVNEYTAEELRHVRLAGTDEGIPTFAEVLTLVNGRVPLLVELKEEAGEYGVTEKAIEMLSLYTGDYIIESFNPLALGKVKKEIPEIYRGVLSDRFLTHREYRAPMYAVLQNLLLNVVCRPDFIAYSHTGWKNLSLRFVRKCFHATTFAWTVRSQEEEDAAFAHGFDAVIFENYIPEK